MRQDLVIVFDCGATHVTAMAINSKGTVVKSAGYPNGPVKQPSGEESWLTWDVEQIWRKMSDACKQVCVSVGKDRVKAVTVCTFGADGAPISRDGKLTYHAISWQDTRTESLVREIGNLIDPWEIFAETGYQIVHFNTLLRLIWLREHSSKALEEAEYWLMMPGLLSFKLSGEFSIDPTSAGTMMAMSLEKRDWSERMLSLAKLDSSFFPKWVEPGDVIGHVPPSVSRRTGLPVNVPVVAAGHDTQFAAIGSGARASEAILSSGTWEILTLRTSGFHPNRFGFEEGLLFENDAVRGFWNPQLLMMGSGVIEWVRKHFYSSIVDSADAYRQMITDAEKVQPGADGVIVLPSFVAETGPTKKYEARGTILGLTLNTDHRILSRAAFEGLSFQLRHALHILSEATGFHVEGIRVVGGGAKNDLWNQIRADVTGLPVRTIEQKEATSIGAALFAFVGAGVFKSLEEAQTDFAKKEAVFKPTTRKTAYDDLFKKYVQLPPALKGFYAPAYSESIEF